MADEKRYEIGECITYKCGSPTFVVLEDKGGENILVTWFNPKTHEPQRFKAPRDAVESIDSFNTRKIEIETKFNDRIYQIPSGLPKEQIITIGFDSVERRNEFMEKIVAENQIAHFFDDDAPTPLKN